jgi:hypothetical protein
VKSFLIFLFGTQPGFVLTGLPFLIVGAATHHMAVAIAIWMVVFVSGLFIAGNLLSERE